ncbi:putative Brefeldin A-inhibited guanine nucleotide-exchange protein 2 [Blattamonas nauphoetae]|uniref:Brefeldin A-inhibited guanine nucleotide-exchange protein 2 n=1 Tax=Blattamonas nauphoetae TaxID=2049346 RepID=A0ABQ9Y2P7_9EUKA|nr:putative Brefeldin A-inhibited guanine nucleotide-exchange protein 2 [Blattamonas nauphoetae]
MSDRLEKAVKATYKACGYKQAQIKESLGQKLALFKSAPPTECNLDFYSPFTEALASQSTDLIVASLESVSVMVDSGFIRGESSTFLSREATLITTVVTSIYSTRHITKLHVQQATLKAYTSLCNSKHILIHSDVFGMVMKHIMRIHLDPSSPTIQNVAGSTLQTQCQTYFMKLRNSTSKIKEKQLFSDTRVSPAGSFANSVGSLRQIDSPLFPESPRVDSPFVSPFTMRRQQSTLSVVSTASNDPDSDEETHPEQTVPSPLLTTTQASPESPMGLMPIDETARAISPQLDQHSDCADEDLAQSQGEERSLSPISVPACDNQSVESNIEEINSDEVIVRDCLSILTLLCKLSTYAPGQDNPYSSMSQTDPQSSTQQLRTSQLSSSPMVSNRQVNDLASAVSLKQRILSLQILYSITTKCGDVLSERRRLSNCVQVNLVPAILSNAGYSNIYTFRLSVALIVEILTHFHLTFKTELESLLTVYLRVLHSKETQITEKQAFLDNFSKVFNDGQLLADIFLNFDCFPGMTSMFERLVLSITSLCTITDQNLPRDRSTSSTKAVVTPHAKLQLNALQSVLSILTALHTFAVPPTQSDLALSDVDIKRSSSAPVNEAQHIEIVDESELLEFEAVQMKKRQIREANRLFNQKPKTGFAFIKEKGIYPDTAEGAAQFFFDNSSELSKVKVGDYFGDPAPYNIEVLRAFLKLIDMRDQEIDQAMTTFLQLFRIPGEGQKIMRILDEFGKEYLRQNPGSFPDSDAAFNCAYTSLAIHSMAHSNIMAVLPVESFIEQNETTGKSVEYLTALYHRLLQHEIKIIDDDDERTKLALEDEEKKLKPKELEAVKRKRALEERELLAKQMEEKIKISHKIVEQSDDLAMAKLEQFGDTASTTGSTIIKKATPAVVHLMTKSIAAPISETIRELLVTTTNDDVAKLCVDILVTLLTLPGSDGQREQNAIVRTLAEATMLFNRVVLTTKNMLVFQSLIELSAPEKQGNLLRDGWIWVIQCAMQVRHLNTGEKHTANPVCSFNAEIDVTSLNDTSISPGLAAPTLAGSSGLPSPNKPAPKDLNTLCIPLVASNVSSRETVNSVNQTFIKTHKMLALADSIFQTNRIANLTNDSFHAFLSALCLIAERDLSTPGIAHPNACLQFLSRIFNQTVYTRSISPFWDGIWPTLSSHAVKVIVHATDQTIAMAYTDFLIVMINLLFVQDDSIRSNLKHLRLNYTEPFNFDSDEEPLPLLSKGMTNSRSRKPEPKEETIQEKNRQFILLYPLCEVLTLSLYYRSHQSSYSIREELYVEDGGFESSPLSFTQDTSDTESIPSISTNRTAQNVRIVIPALPGNVLTKIQQYVHTLCQNQRRSLNTGWSAMFRIYAVLAREERALAVRSFSAFREIFTSLFVYWIPFSMKEAIDTCVAFCRSTTCDVQIRLDSMALLEMLAKVFGGKEEVPFPSQSRRKQSISTSPPQPLPETTGSAQPVLQQTPQPAQSTSKDPLAPLDERSSSTELKKIPDPPASLPTFQTSDGSAFTVIKKVDSPKPPPPLSQPTLVPHSLTAQNTSPLMSLSFEEKQVELIKSHCSFFDELHVESVWFPIFTACRSLVNSVHADVRRRTYELIRYLLFTHRSVYCPSFWPVINQRLLLPLMEQTTSHVTRYEHLLTNPNQNQNQMTVDSMTGLSLSAAFRSEQQDGSLRMSSPAFTPPMTTEAIIRLSSATPTLSPLLPLDDSVQGESGWIAKTLDVALTVLMDCVLNEMMRQDHSQKPQIFSTPSHLSGASTENDLFDPFLQMMGSIILTESDDTSPRAVAKLQQFLEQAGKYISLNEWNLIVDCFKELMQQTRPVELTFTPTFTRRIPKSLDHQGFDVNPLAFSAALPSASTPPPDNLKSRDPRKHASTIGKSEGIAIQNAAKSKTIQPLKPQTQRKSGRVTSSKDNILMDKYVPDPPFDPRGLMQIEWKRNTQKRLIQCFNLVIETHFRLLPPSILFPFLNEIHKVMVFAHEFDHNMKQRAALSVAIYGESVPTLREMEELSTSCYMNILSKTILKWAPCGSGSDEMSDNRTSQPRTRLKDFLVTTKEDSGESTPDPVLSDSLPLKRTKLSKGMLNIKNLSHQRTFSSLPPHFRAAAPHISGMKGSLSLRDSPSLDSPSSSPVDFALDLFFTELLREVADVGLVSTIEFTLPSQTSVKRAFSSLIQSAQSSFLQTITQNEQEEEEQQKLSEDSISPPLGKPAHVFPSPNQPTSSLRQTYTVSSSTDDIEDSTQVFGTSHKRFSPSAMNRFEPLPTTLQSGRAVDASIVARVVDLPGLCNVLQKSVELLNALPMSLISVYLDDVVSVFAQFIRINHESLNKQLSSFFVRILPLISKRRLEQFDFTAGFPLVSRTSNTPGLASKSPS